ncbi:MAG: tRNA preQ1(34) S-adenosylmethionine ribosyltransferase-isomerase QueA [Rhodospirillales bacterium]|nr:tRNA preQ1(34) S-adenosylmethionine ribosyltransferase-isomerase QueA [Rhodospirillales bacterium]
MKREDFDFSLPTDRIAQRPAVPRDSARLLTVGETRDDQTITDLPRLLRPGDLLVLNDTRVIASRLFGWRGSVRIEATLIERHGAGVWWALAKPARRLKPGDRIDVACGFAPKVVAKRADGAVLLDLAQDDAALAEALEAHGAAPLPPYIRRNALDPRDRRDYQTVFADRPGAVAAPTAGLHFTPALIAALEAAGIAMTCVTLHVGAGTFLPVKTERLEDHIMHSETGEIGAAAVAAITRCRTDGGRVIAVGTTSLRLLETAADERGDVHEWSGETSLFITPGFGFRIVDRLLTNFHLPCSTLFMLVCAFAGTQRMREAYAHAIERGYRFYSYGDACLLDRAVAS